MVRCVFRIMYALVIRLPSCLFGCLFRCCCLRKRTQIASKSTLDFNGSVHASEVGPSPIAGELSLEQSSVLEAPPTSLPPSMALLQASHVVSQDDVAVVPVQTSDVVDKGGAVVAVAAIAEQGTAAAWLKERRSMKSEMDQLRSRLSASSASQNAFEKMHMERDELRHEVQRLQLQMPEAPAVDEALRHSVEDAERLRHAVKEGDTLRNEVDELRSQVAFQKTRLKEALDHGMHMADTNTKLSSQLEMELEQLRNLLATSGDSQKELEKSHKELETLRHENERLKPRAPSKLERSPESSHTDETFRRSLPEYSEHLGHAADELVALRDELTNLRERVASQESLGQSMHTLDTQSRLSKELAHLQELALSLYDTLSDHEEDLS